MAKIKGIDVSKWQGTIDWNKVKNDGIDFAIIRASQGKENNDPMFEVNYAGAKKAGIAVGAYHYCYAKSKEKAKEEADNFIAAAKGKIFEYPLVIDMEDNSLDGLSRDILTEITNVFLSIVAKEGYKTMVYASKSWFDSKLDVSKLGEHKIWIARYNDTLGYEGRYDMWQYSSSGKVDGISTKVDMDYCYTDISSLKDHTGTTQYESKTPQVKTSSALLTVKEVQKKLNSIYGLHIATDNKFGQETLKAIIKGLQTEHNKSYKAGLKVDGIFGSATRNELTVIQKGMQGNITFLLQSLLICKGYSLKPYGADGNFGDLTEGKVRSYQKAQGICVDGIVGIATWSKLLSNK